MTLSKSNPRAKPRWAMLVVTVVAMVLALAGGALATKIDGFEIDAAEGTGLVPYYSGNDPSTFTADDWAQGASGEGVFTGSAGTECYNSNIDVNPDIEGAAAVICDGTSDPGFKAVEKENSIVSPSGKTPDDVWPIKPGNNTPKNDVTHGYTLIREFDSPCVATTGPDSLIVFLAGERLNNEGDSFWGFELNQDAPTGFEHLTANQGGGDGTNFSLDFNRTVGDVLVSVSLQKGGTVPTIEVYEVTGFNADGSAIFELAPTTCGAGTPVSQGQTNAATDATAPPWNVLVCDPSSTNASNNCRLVNGGQTDSAIPPRDFIEVAVDLGQYDIAPACFNNVIFTSRSSSSVTADLKDVGGGTVPLCSSAATTEIHEGTSATDVANEPNIDGGSIFVGQTIHDKAIVTATGIGSGAPAPTGTVTFDRFANDDCTGDPVASEDVALGLDGTAESSDFTTTTAGDVSYLATYNGDDSYPSTVAACETVAVNKRNSATLTQIHAGSSADAGHSTTDIQGTTVTAGTVVHDFASVTESGSTGGTTPTGNVLFKRYSTSDCTGTSTDQTVALGALATAETSDFTTVDGSLSYRATYQGDAYYNASTESGCEVLTAITPTTILDKQASFSLDVTYHYQEKNDGSVDLQMPADGYVEDDQCAPVLIVGDTNEDNTLDAGETWSGDDDEDGILSAGETWDFICEMTLTAADLDAEGDFTNVALGHGTDPLGLDVTWCEDTENPPAGVRCDQDETDTVTITLTIDQGKDELFLP